MKKIIIFGGEGYIGKVLSKSLIDKNYNVSSYDNLTYEDQSFSFDKNLISINEDILNTKKLLSSLDSVDAAIILAGLVGDPITKKYPDYSIKVNEIGVKSIINACITKKINRLIFVSTCSNYGLIPSDVKANEEYILNPISLYAKSKIKIENYIMSLKNKKLITSPTILRFATAFGYSPRMRFDLTVNQFVKEMWENKEITVYDKETWRPYCHVKDFARLMIKILEAPKEIVDFEIFNAGGDENNYTKEMIAESIKNILSTGKINYLKNDVDPRNYRVNFDKLKKIINFTPKYSIEYGIEEVLSKIKQNKFSNIKNFHGNFLIKDALN
tara:strand:+ start:1983 stop:2966 length:984 start_codon:yes stop_codon:yes gene_type:complete